MVAHSLFCEIFMNGRKVNTSRVYLTVTVYKYARKKSSAKQSPNILCERKWNILKNNI